LKLKKILSLVLVLSIVFATLCTTSCKKKSKDDNNDNNGSNDNSSNIGDNIVEEQPGKNGSEGRTEFISTIGGVSDTFEGVVSSESYNSPEAAAEAYVADEVVGNSGVEILSTTSKGVLSNSEITKLNLPEDVKAGLTSVEEIEVKYSEITATTFSNSVTADTLDTSKTVKVYVIKYTNDWKYFSPAPITGDTITKSYYDSVFNYEKYKNCTIESSYLLTVNASGTDGIDTYSTTVELRISQLIKHADNKVYLEQVIETSEDGVSDTTTIYAYLEEQDGNVVCYVKIDPTSETWYPTDLTAIGFGKMEELTPFYDQYLDYTYFTKTNYGFVLDKDNAELYVSQVLADSLSEFGDILSSDGLNIDMFAEYYVSAGVLSGMRMDVDLSFAMTEDGISLTATETVTSDIKCTNYGTTVVEKPFTE